MIDGGLPGFGSGVEGAQRSGLERGAVEFGGWAGGRSFVNFISFPAANRSSQFHLTPHFHLRRGNTILGGVPLCRSRKGYGGCMAARSLCPSTQRRTGGFRIKVNTRTLRKPGEQLRHPSFVQRASWSVGCVSIVANCAYQVRYVIGQECVRHPPRRCTSRLLG